MDSKRYVGDEKSELFGLVVLKKIMDLFGEVLPMVDNICKLKEAELEKKLKEHLGDEYKKWLEGNLKKSKLP